MNNSREKKRSDWENPGWMRVGAVIGWLLMMSAVALAEIFDFFHFFANYSYIHQIAEAGPSIIVTVLFFFLVFERFTVLGPTKKKVEAIESTVEKFLDSLDRASNSIIKQLSNPVTLEINETAQATYIHILSVLDSVEKDKPDAVKSLRHGIFHAEGASDTSSEVEYSYFVRFGEKMKAISGSSGCGRWNVQVLYNVTHLDRLEVIRNRLDFGTEGYEVRGMCMRDFSPVFSPMVIDDQHVFLAVFEEGKNRVSRTVYMHGEKAAKFFADYFDRFWAKQDGRLVSLCEDGKINEEGIEQLKSKISGISAAAHP